MRSDRERTNLREVRTFVVLTATFRTHTLGLRNEATARRAEVRPSVVQHTRSDTPASPDQDHTLGIPPAATQPLMQTDAFKELVNKLSWALGSTYRKQYGQKRSPVRLVAQQMATSVMVVHGYPAHLAK